MLTAPSEALLIGEASTVMVSMDKAIGIGNTRSKWPPLVDAPSGSLGADAVSYSQAWRRSGTRFAGPLAVSILSLSWPNALAAAELTKDECVDANARAQELRLDGRLRAASVEFGRCAGASCPAIVRDDCSSRLDEVDKALPSVVFGAKDAAGADLSEVRVWVDGELLLGSLDGKALTVDPGAHSFTFEAEGRPPITMRLLILEGEKGRHQRVIMGQARVSAPRRAAQLQVESPLRVSGKTIGLSLAGAGIVGLATGTVFGVLASSALTDAERTCGGDTHQCTDVASAKPQWDAMLEYGTISTVGFVAGGALLTAGTLVYLAAARTPRPQANFALASVASSLKIAPKIGSTHAGIALHVTLP